MATRLTCLLTEGSSYGACYLLTLGAAGSCEGFSSTLSSLGLGFFFGLTLSFGTASSFDLQTLFVLLDL